MIAKIEDPAARNSRIAKIIPYFGSWPSYLPLYLHSCQYNAQIDVLFFTDLEPPEDSPANVSYHFITFTELLAKISSTLEIDIPDIEPYKLCDYRPMYGLIFSEFLEDYDFWGYGDIDLIFGDVPSFLTAEILQNHDILSFKKGHLQGPFTIYRNTETIKYLFKKSENYVEILQNPQYCSFDEFGKQVFYVNLENEESVRDLPNDNISVIAFKESLEGKLRIYNRQNVKESLSSSDVVVFDKGKVFDLRNGEQFIFYHWVLEKRATWFHYESWFATKPDRFFVAHTGFYLPTQFRYFQLIKSIRWMKGLFIWLWLKGSNFLKRRLGGTVTIDTYPKIGWIKRL